MEATRTINNILSEARKLSKEEQLALLQRLMLLLKKPEPAAENAVRISALSGVGSELWGDASAIDAYLDDERCSKNRSPGRRIGRGFCNQ